MQIQINTSHNVEGNVALSAHVNTVVKKALHHMDVHLTRVEVYLDDDSSSMAGVHDKSCKMEVRPKHREPMVVCHKANNMHQAVDGAVRKLKSSLEHMLGRLEHQRRNPAIIESEKSQ